MLAGAVVAPWVRRPVVWDVGGVRIVEQVSSSGAEFAGRALLVALAVVVLGLAALLVPRARRVLAVLLWLAAFLGPGIVVTGVAPARQSGGALTPAPFVAFLAGFVAFLGAAMMRIGPRAHTPLLDQRYTVEGGEPEDEEWRIASEEPDGEHPGDG